jgi:hypothetical protein
MRIIAEGLKDSIQLVLQNQSFNWKPLNVKYLAKKFQSGLDVKILLATHEYYNSIEVQRIQSTTDGVMYRIGVKDGIHKPSGLEYNTLAKIHEFGTSSIPPRSHWRPVWARFVVGIKQIGTRINSKIIQEIRRKNRM